MSEYQYYEFQAIDRRLTDNEMAELRRITSRAEITPTSLINEYHWGDFKGNPHKLMEKYFDLFFYFANWGTNQLMLRLPRAAVDTEELSEFAHSEFFSHEVHKNSVVLDFRSEDESGEWIEDSDFSVGSIGRVREEVMAGDKRALYLGWLSTLCQDYTDVEDDDFEPPVPPGLADLSPALTELAAFLRISTDLIVVAAEWSQPLAPTKSDTKAMQKWVSTVPADQKDAWLSRILRGEEFGLRAEMLREFQSSQKQNDDAAAPPAQLARRTAGELRQAAEAHRQKREKEYAAAQEREKLRREREAAAAQAKRLAALAGKEESAWRKVETLAASADYAAFDEAVELLKDLRSLALENQEYLTFSTRMQEIRKHHSKKRALLGRLKKAMLF